jgi:hypothetical protein
MTHAEELLSEKGKLRLDLAILTGEHEALLARIEAELKERDSLQKRLEEAETITGELTALMDELSGRSHDYHEKYYPEEESLRPKRASSALQRGKV